MSRQRWKPRRRSRQGSSSLSPISRSFRRLPEHPRGLLEVSTSGLGISWIHGVPALLSVAPLRFRCNHIPGRGRVVIRRREHDAVGRRVRLGLRLRNSGPTKLSKAGAHQSGEQTRRQSPGRHRATCVDAPHLFDNRGVRAATGRCAGRCPTADYDTDAGFVSDVTTADRHPRREHQNIAALAAVVPPPDVTVEPA